MELVRVTNQSNLRRIDALLTEAFPPDERTPLRFLLRKARRGKADFWELVDGDTWAGIAYVVCCKDLAYLFYLAIEASVRSHGYGTQTIALLQEQYAGKRFFLALELLDETADNFEQRVRRHEFYLRCGLKDLPYLLKESRTIYQLMGNAGPVQPEEYKELMDGYLGWPTRLFEESEFIDES